jgi:hypothetical protein
VSERFTHVIHGIAPIDHPRDGVGTHGDTRRDRRRDHGEPTGECAGDTSVAGVGEEPS